MPCTIVAVTCLPRGVPVHEGIKETLAGLRPAPARAYIQYQTHPEQEHVLAIDYAKGTESDSWLSRYGWDGTQVRTREVASLLHAQRIEQHLGSATIALLAGPSLCSAPEHAAAAWAETLQEPEEACAVASQLPQPMFLPVALPVELLTQKLLSTLDRELDHSRSEEGRAETSERLWSDMQRMAVAPGSFGSQHAFGAYAYDSPYQSPAAPSGFEITLTVLFALLFPIMLAVVVQGLVDVFLYFFAGSGTKATSKSATMTS